MDTPEIKDNPSNVSNSQNVDDNGVSSTKIFVIPQPIKVKEEIIDEAETEESIDGNVDESANSDLNSEANLSEVFDKEKSPEFEKIKKKKDFNLNTNECLSRLSFTELLEYTNNLSSHFKKKDKKIKKLKEKVKYLKSVISKLKDKRKDEDKRNEPELGTKQVRYTNNNITEHLLDSDYQPHKKIMRLELETETDNSSVDEHLKVAVINKTRLDGKISSKCWKDFRGFFFDGIRSFISIRTHGKRLPFYEFCGINRGIRWITCGDNESLSFLKDILNNFNFYSDDISLSIVARDKIPRWKKYSVLLTNSSENQTFQDQETVLMCTNSHIGSENWVFHPRLCSGAPISVDSRTNIFISMSESDEELLKKANFYVYYGLEKIKMYKANDSN